MAAEDSVDFSAISPDLDKALEAVRKSPEEGAKFAADPKGYLESKGVSTESLNFGDPNAGELSENDLEKVAGGGHCAWVGGATMCGGSGTDNQY